MATKPKTRKNQLTTKSPPRPARPSNAKPFDAVFKRLKKILVPYAKDFTITADSLAMYTIVGPSRNKTAKRFGSVAIRRTHVTFYSCPAILSHASPALQAHMSGTASVNFTETDESLTQELTALTARRFQDYLTNGWL